MYLYETNHVKSACIFVVDEGVENTGTLDARMCDWKQAKFESATRNPNHNKPGYAESFDHTYQTQIDNMMWEFLKRQKTNFKSGSDRRKRKKSTAAIQSKKW